MNFSINNSMDELEQFEDPSTYQWSYLLAAVFFLPAGIYNILTCLTVAMNRELQNYTNFLLISLAVADLLVIFFVTPLAVVQAVLGECPALDLPFMALQIPNWL